MWSRTDYERTQPRNPTMQEKSDIEALAERFDLNDAFDAEDDIPEPIQDAMRQIAQSTGLLGDYNDGVVQLCEGGRTIQWYPRRRMFSTGDNLLTWVQEHDGLILGQVGTREHPVKGETAGYIEIMERSRWVSDEEPDEEPHAEVKLTPEGISMSLYDGMDLLDEGWQTWGELSPDHEIPPVDEEMRFSLRVIDDE